MAVVGRLSVIQTCRGQALGERSGWPARNWLNSPGVSSAPSTSTNAAITWSPTCSSGTAYTATWLTAGSRCRMRSMGAVVMFSPSTRNQSPLRPAK